jgi:hypothetical protein
MNHLKITLYVLTVLLLLIWEQNEPRKQTDMLNVTAGSKVVTAAERCTGQNLYSYSYVTTSVNSDIVAVIVTLPDNGIGTIA